MKKIKIELFAKSFLVIFLSVCGCYLIEDTFIFIGVFMMIWANNVDREI